MRLPITPKPTNPKLAILNSVRGTGWLCILDLYRNEQIRVPSYTQVVRQTHLSRKSLSVSAYIDGTAVALFTAMTKPGIAIAVLAAMLSACALVAQNATAVIRSRPLPSPQAIEDLELQVLRNPEDLQARLNLLQFYLDTAPPGSGIDSGRRSVRLQHILYLVERHPESAVSASKAAYAYRASGPYANAADHDEVRDQWLAAVQSRPKDNTVVLNAVKFLEREDPEDAERTLRRVVNADPDNREIAANLGFLYAKEILAGHPSTELEQSSDAIVLAAAGTALANLSKSFDSINGTMLDLAGKLSSRARQLAPDDREIQGLMPFIQYFIAAEETLRGAIALPAPSAPSRIRVGGNVQSANLIRKTEPKYPEAARSTGITGDVSLSIIIGRDGTIQNVQVISGPPLLVQAALEAVETWIYKPTLLNGSPVEVVTTVTVSFPPN
jgi:TonB family protein